LGGIFNISGVKIIKKEKKEKWVESEIRTSAFCLRCKNFAAGRSLYKRFSFDLFLFLLLFFKQHHTQTPLAFSTAT